MTAQDLGFSQTIFSASIRQVPFTAVKFSFLGLGKSDKRVSGFIYSSLETAAKRQVDTLCWQAETLCRVVP